MNFNFQVLLDRFSLSKTYATQTKLFTMKRQIYLANF